MNSDLRSILWSHDLDSGKCSDAFFSNTDLNWWYSFGTSSSKVFSAFGSSLCARLCDIDVLALIDISELTWMGWFRGSSFSGSDVTVSPWRYAVTRSPSDSSSSVIRAFSRLHYGTITIETTICPMADRGTQMGPMAVHVMGPCMGPMPWWCLRLNVGPNDQPK